MVESTLSPAPPSPAPSSSAAAAAVPAAVPVAAPAAVTAAPAAPAAQAPARPRLRGLAPSDADTRGRRMLAGLANGTVAPPPAAHTLRLPPATSWLPGLISCETEFDESLTLTPGVVFGGWIANLTDHFAGLVMLSAIPDGTGFLTAGLSVQYHAPLLPGPVFIETELISCSTRIAVAEVRFVQDGTRTCTGTVEQIIHRGGGGDA
ncbi:PaaI family thioesterase [Streptomyces sp. N2-109]|uniref:PaaI family thioesterase n=1 Tax=Streptomyces gossypii TaxID=2883101 RepID=A0ABT2JPK7_9ACTN|nr:PaaI family thioesterase [Streptomyces gossypii]MCT2589315.1 PaaI family thioesterase [Streptomyces gossypii]